MVLQVKAVHIAQQRGKKRANDLAIDSGTGAAVHIARRFCSPAVPPGSAQIKQWLRRWLHGLDRSAIELALQLGVSEAGFERPAQRFRNRFA